MSDPDPRLHKIHFQVNPPIAARGREPVEPEVAEDEVEHAAGAHHEEGEERVPGAGDVQVEDLLGRALHRLGIEHILGYSPQARGRSERVNRTLQDRLVNELRVAGIHTLPPANRYLRERFLPGFNTEFGRAPAAINEEMWQESAGSALSMGDLPYSATFV